jgi:hypothetical protein
MKGLTPREEGERWGNPNSRKKAQKAQKRMRKTERHDGSFLLGLLLSSVNFRFFRLSFAPLADVAKEGDGAKSALREIFCLFDTLGAC